MSSEKIQSAPASDNNGKNLLVELGLAVPFFYVFILLSIHCYERGYFDALGLEKRLIQVEPLNNLFLVFSLAGALVPLISIAQSLSKYRNDYWKPGKKTWWQILGAIAILVIGLFEFYYEVIKYLVFDAMDVSYVILLAFFIYGISFKLQRENKEQQTLKHLLVWLSNFFLITGISCLACLIIGNKEGLKEKRKIITEGGRHLIRNYDRYSIYCNIDTAGQVKTTFYITESKNDTIVISR